MCKTAEALSRFRDTHSRAVLRDSEIAQELDNHMARTRSKYYILFQRMPSKG